jgi:RsiW-degrading membrane proteinase PrsW (M82 family)
MMAAKSQPAYCLSAVVHILRPHLPRIGVGILILLQLLELYLCQWDVSLPYGLVGGWGFYVLALLCMAIAPGYALGLYLYHRDRYYDQSWVFLGRLFFYGILSGPVAGLGEWIAITLSGYREKSASLADHFVFFFFVVGFLEELVKFAVVWKLAYRSQAFKQVYDGLLFCGASALGFATMENILYVFSRQGPSLSRWP